MSLAVPYRPPAPRPLSPVRALMRGFLSGGRDLLSVLPQEAYRVDVAPLGVSRRGILLVNDPALVRRVLGDEAASFPKNDLFVSALEPLIGNGVFISSGDDWRRQRRMIEPSFGHMQIGRAFASMEAAADALEPELDERAAQGLAFSLDAMMSRLTADVICRTVFSTTLESAAAQRIFDEFARFQETVASVRLDRLLWGRPGAPVRQPATARTACERIRAHISAMIAAHPAALGKVPPESAGDIAGDIMAARDQNGEPAFRDRDLVDQIGVFFLAGHETSASAVTWALFVLSQRPDLMARVRAEIEAEAPFGRAPLDVVKRLTVTRALLRETLRLYPPGPFLPRVAAQDCELAGHRLRPGAMVMISPWIIHRHERLWPNPDIFDLDRFIEQNERRIPAGAYLPFGYGPRVCVGAAFATIESTHILARIVQRYDLEVMRPESVQPAARLTIRPAHPIHVRLRRR